MTVHAGGPSRTLLSDGSWDGFLDFLDPGHPEKLGPDRDRAAEAKYLEIVRKLICFFAGRGCVDAEDLAMEAVLRVAAKCKDVDTSGYQDRIGYFYGVARNVLHEWRHDVLRESAKREALRGELKRSPTSDPQSWSKREAIHRCLDLCLAKLPQRARRLVLGYYGEERAARIEGHKKLADEFGKSMNALRIEVHRIRKLLRGCVAGCVAPEATPSRGRS